MRGAVESSKLVKWKCYGYILRVPGQEEIELDDWDRANKVTGSLLELKGEKMDVG